MSEKRYVQHISGQGRKWEILSDCCHESEWRVKAKTHEYYHDLPKSEYILCDPPEEWEDVTRECKHIDGHYDVLLDHGKRFKYIDYLHNGPAFLVERRKS